MYLASESNRTLAFNIMTLLLIFTKHSWADTVIEPVKNTATEQASDWQTVTGRFVWPKGVKPRDFKHNTCSISLSVDEARLHELIQQLNQTPAAENCFPKEFKDWDESKKMEFYRTKEGSKALTAKNKALNEHLHEVLHVKEFELASDGSFSLEAVRSGTYRMYMDAYATDADKNKVAKGRFIAHYFTEDLVVPPVEGGGNKTAHLDLGEFEVIPVRKPLEVGDIAYDFEAPVLSDSIAAPLLSGQRVRLSELRGKLVLLEFSAAGCLGCHQEIPAIKAIWQRFHEDERFLVLGMFCDEKPEHAIDGFIMKYDLPWQCVYLGSVASSATMYDYGIHAIPTSWLIGPGGKVLARNLRGEKEIRASIEKALSTFTN